MTLLRSVGNSKVPLASMIVSSVVNIVLDLLFVFPFGMGVFGAALATVLAQVVSALYCLVYIRRAAELLPRKTDWRADGVLLGALVGKGLPVAVMNSVTAVGGMVLQVFVNQMGTAYVAAYAACMKVCGLFEQPGITLGLALLTFTGQNYGAGKYDRIKQGVRAGVVLSVLVNLPFAALEIFCPKFLASLMLNDATVISYTCIFLPVTGVALFALGGLFVFRNACQGMGKISSADGVRDCGGCHARHGCAAFRTAPCVPRSGIRRNFRMGRSWSYAYDYLLFLSEAALRENSRCERIKGEVICKNPACTAL